MRDAQTALVWQKMVGFVMAPKANDTKMRDAIRDDAIDPFKFEAFLGAWNAFLVGPTDASAMLDADAEQALLDIAAGGDSDVVGVEIRRMINRFPNPALVIRHDGVILSQNEAALLRMDVDPGDLVDDYPSLYLVVTRCRSGSMRRLRKAIRVVKCSFCVLSPWPRTAA